MTDAPNEPKGFRDRLREAVLAPLARHLGGYAQYAVLVLILSFSVLPLSYALNFTLAFDAPMVGLVAVGLFFLPLLLGASLIASDKFLKAILADGLRYPTALSIAFAYAATLVFGGATCALQRVGVVAIEPTLLHGENCASRYADLYLWHFLDAIPLIEFHETIDWPLPYATSDPYSPWLLLGFKVFVIVPVIGSFVAWARIRNDGKG